MKKISLLLLSMLMIIFFACKKNEVNNDDTNPPYQSKGFIPLKVGSYWIYQEYKVLNSGSDTALSRVDSTYISGTTTINSKTYYITKNYGIGKSTVYIRDSLGYLVDTLGKIVMSENNFSDTIISNTEYMPNNSPSFHISRIMFNEHKQVTVPAGSFTDCIEGRDRVKVYLQGTAQPNPYFQHSYYAKNVGLIEYSFRFVKFGIIFKMKLIRYYIPN